MKNNKNNNNWLIILLSSIIVSFILWNTYVFVQNFKTEERNKMELWSLATLELIDIDQAWNLGTALKFCWRLR